VPEMWMGILLLLSRWCVGMPLRHVGKSTGTKCDCEKNDTGNGRWFDERRDEKLRDHSLDDQVLSELQGSDGEERRVQSHDVRPVQLRLVLGLRETMDGGLSVESLVRLGAILECSMF